MARARTVGVSVTPEARAALNDLVVEVITATRERVSQSDALRIEARVVARHTDELPADLVAIGGNDV